MNLRKAWAANFLVCELLVGLLVVAALVIWSEFWAGSPQLNQFLCEHGETLYIVLAPITAAMLGFILAAAAIVVTAAPAERLELLRKSKHYPTLWATFRSAMRFLGFATLSAILALFVSGPFVSRLAFFATAGLSLLAAARVARCVWAMNWVIRIFTGPSPATEGAERASN